LDYRVANIFSMIVSKAAAFFCNKYLVFRKSNSLERNEIFRFIFARVLSGFVDFFGLIFIVSGLHFDEVYGKVFMLVVVTIMNYVLGKYFVFRK
ncbi:MAG: GtrA family protein, partial [Mucispirillum sp.]|nr:GtrA family protein [Mucispirillum sp.]